MNLLLIDNYDSFTYNLVETIRQLDLAVNITVKRNDKLTLDEVVVYDKIMLSPGPGVPSEAGLLKEVIARYAETKPILGVCLGHQAIGEVFGAQLQNLESVLHGIETIINCKAHYLFEQVSTTPVVGRYHSWVIEPSSLPSILKIIAEDENGQIMAISHETYDVCGIQFHPESVMTPEGSQMIKNWIQH